MSDINTNSTSDLSDSELAELLDFADMVSGGASKPAPEVRRETPSQTPALDEDDDIGAMLAAVESPKAGSALPSPETSEDPILPVPPPMTRRTVIEDDGDDISTFLASTGITSQREVPDITKPWMKHHEFTLVKSVQEVERIVDEAIHTGKCALDLETEGLDNRVDYDERGKPRTKHQIVGFCLSPGDGHKGYYVPVRHRPTDDGPAQNVDVEGVEAAISRLCWAAQPVPQEGAQDPLSFKDFKEPPKVIIDFWNAKFDQEFLYPVTGIDWWHPDSFEDGMLASFVVYTDDRSFSLKDKAMEMLRDPEGHPYEMIKLKELFPNGRRILFPSLAPDEPGVVKYACSDAVCTRLLCEHPETVKKIRSRKADLAGTYRIEKQVIQVMRVMERNRVRVHRQTFQGLLEVYGQKRDEVRRRIIDLAASKGFPGFEPGSPKQLSDFLFGEAGLNITPKPEKNEKSGQYKTDASTLEQMANDLGEHAPQVLKWIIEYREHDKMIGTYLQSLVNNPDQNDELRFSFKETGAATGRFSAPQGQADQGYSGVPIHGIPSTSSLREAFIARPGYTMCKSDYAGQELRIAANVSGEGVWVNEFLHGEGDLHTITARAFFGVEKPSKEQRKMAKGANFALVYGGGPAAIMRATGCDKPEASRRKQAFDKAVPTFAKWIKGQHKTVRERKGVWTAFGRWIAIPDIDNPDQGVRAACERHSTNYPIQGSGADIMKIALILLHKEFFRRGWLRTGGGDDSVRMLLTVHDEIVFEIRNERVPEVVPIIVRIMASPTNMPKPPFSPQWKVPLVVEPLLGLSWGGSYNWEHLTEGKKGKLSDLKDDEKPMYVQVGDHVYQTVPPWLEGILQPGWERHGGAPEPAPQVPLVAAPPVVSQGPSGTPQEASTETMVEAVPPSSPPPSAPVLGPQVTPQPTMQSTSTVSGNKGVVSFRIGKLTRDTIRIVRVGCAEALDVDCGAVLRLVDPVGNILIDPSLGVKVDPDLFSRFLRDRTLSDGAYLLDENPVTR